MRISLYNYKQYTKCDRFYFLNDLYVKRNLSEVKLSGSSTNKILNEMFDKEGNDKISLPLILSNNQEDEVKEEIKSKLNEKNAQYDLKYEFIDINKNIIEADIDIKVEKDDTIDFYKISLSTTKTFKREYKDKDYVYEGKRETFGKLVIKITPLEEVKKSKMLQDYAYFKYVYNNSFQNNNYKEVRYNLVLINSETSSNKILDLIDIYDVTDLLQKENYNIEGSLNEWNSLKQLQILKMYEETKPKKCPTDCKFYNICNAKEKNIKNTEIIDKEQLTKEISKIKYPIYYLDFESYASIKPRFKGEKPYSQHVFLYSLIKQDKMLRHYNYMAPNNQDDFRYQLFKKMCQDIDLTSGGTIFVYNETFEKARIKEAAAIFPDLKEKLDLIYEHIVDLLKIVKKTYFNEALGGSYSIKKVLPFFDNEGYENQEIKNGQEASIVYGALHLFDDEERKEKIKQLIKYCDRDTEAMYYIYQGLKKRVSFD